MRRLKFTAVFSRKSANNSVNIRCVSFMAIATIALSSGAVFAGDANKTVRTNRCASMGEGFMPIEGADGCFRIGGHIRVESGVMHGTASLHDNSNTTAYVEQGRNPASESLLPSGVHDKSRSHDGAMRAGLKSDTTGTTRLRMHPSSTGEPQAR